MQGITKKRIKRGICTCVAVSLIGAGVGNTRQEISQETLGIPVVAIGIPTVVELATLVSDGIDIFIDRLQEKAESNEYLNKLQQNDKYEEVKEALNVGEYNMIVTPKEIALDIAE